VLRRWLKTPVRQGIAGALLLVVAVGVYFAVRAVASPGPSPAPKPRPTIVATRHGGVRAWKPVRRWTIWAADHLLGFRYREKRLRLDGLPPASRRMTIAGLAAIVVLMLLVAYPRLLDFGEPLYPGGGVEVLSAAPAVGIIGLGVTATVLVYATGLCGWPLRLATGVGWVGVLAISGTYAGSLRGGLVLDIAGIAARVGYLAVPLGLLGSAIAPLVARFMRLVHFTHGARWLELAEPVVAVVAAAGSAVFFAAVITAYLAGPPVITNATAADFLFSLDLTAYVALPLVFIAALSVVNFAYGIGQLTAGTLAKRGRVFALPVLAGVIAAESLALGYGQFAAWGHQPARDALVAGWLAAFGGTWYLLRDREPDPRLAEDQSAGTHGALVLAGPQLIAPVLIAAFFVFRGRYTTVPAIANFIDDYLNFTSAQDNQVTNDATRLLFAVMLLAAVPFVFARRETVQRRHLALAYVFLALWVLASLLPGPPGSVLVVPSLPQIPLLAGLVVLVLLVWRRFAAADAALLTGIVVFAWLVETNGDFIGIVGKLAGFPSNVTLLVGVALALLGDSEFAGRDGTLLPRRARAPLWAGYIGLSLALTLLSQWKGTPGAFGSQSSSGLVLYDTDTWSASAFSEIGLPLAAWLLLTGRLQPKPASEAKSDVAAKPAVSPEPERTSSQPPSESAPSAPPATAE
jgi:hypothetical protein